MTASKIFEKLARRNLHELRHSLAYQVASTEGKERLAQFGIDCAVRGLSIDHQRIGGSAVTIQAGLRDDIDPARLERIGGRAFRYTLIGSRAVVAGAAVGALKAPGPRPEDPDRYATPDERKQRQKQIAEWERQRDNFHVLTRAHARFSLIELNSSIPDEQKGGSCDVLVIVPYCATMPDPIELPEDAQALRETLLVDFVSGSIERLEVIEAREKQEAHLARRAAKKAREAEAAKKAC